MRDEKALIRTIENDPADSTPRLIYADWLEEYDQPRKARFLRTELELAASKPDSQEAASLRCQLWQSWSEVDSHWLHTFTQPRMLRANPTPYPSVWEGIHLDPLRPGEGTYGLWPYDELPPIPLDRLNMNFLYAKPFSDVPELNSDIEREDRLTCERTLSTAAALGVRLPASFLAFLNRRDLRFSNDSPTDCFFALPDDYTPIRPDASGDCHHFHFYCDSQSCVLWDLLIHRNGAHCVIGRTLDFFEPRREPEEEGVVNTWPEAVFAAPSFETFLYRTSIENRVWYILHAESGHRHGWPAPEPTPESQAYMDFYQSRRRTS